MVGMRTVIRGAVDWESAQWAKAQYSTAKGALRKRFEPDSWREVYMAEFHTRKGHPSERWEQYKASSRQSVSGPR